MNNLNARTSAPKDWDSRPARSVPTPRKVTIWPAVWSALVTTSFFALVAALVVAIIAWQTFLPSIGVLWLLGVL